MPKAEGTLSAVFLLMKRYYELNKGEDVAKHILVCIGGDSFFFLFLETASKCKLHSWSSLLFCWVGRENWLLFSLRDTDVENSDVYLSP